MQDGAFWTQNGGDLRVAAERIASDLQAGALLAIEVERDSLQRERARGLSREAEGELLKRCWDIALTRLPDQSSGKRALWARLEFVVQGDQQGLVEVANRIVDAMTRDERLGRMQWHVVLTEIFVAEVVRTFMCDPGYELAAWRGKTVIAWVEPHAGADWREAQRYPTVTIVRGA